MYMSSNGRTKVAGDSHNVNLSRADLNQFLDLLRVFAQAFEDQEHYQSAVPSDGYLKRLLARADFIPMVAIADGKVVGGLVAYVMQKFEQERSEIYIYDLAVL